MMDPFDEWISKAAGTHSCIQKWGDRLIELGATWDTFRREHLVAVVDDLVLGGIPLLAARDIVQIASEEISRSHAPMAIFWDLENMPIPTNISGREVATRLKSVLEPCGDLVQFRGYASIGLGLIPQEKRSDLQLSNCQLVDCPHSGRKEVADKMIIVDAMQFAFAHPKGATLCFVTGDVDYAYLLAVLQRPQWRTIVISKGTMQSMLHVNCDMKMRWESDILQLQPSLPSTVQAPPGFAEPPADADEEKKLACKKDSSALPLPGRTSQDESFDDTHAAMSRKEAVPPSDFVTLTSTEKWNDDAELLRAIVHNGPSYSTLFSPGHHHVLKSYVGNTLRQTNPARFPHRQAVKDFLAQAVESGVVIEAGEGATKTFYLPSSGSSGIPRPSIHLSKSAPITAEHIPTRVLEMAINLPFILFVQWFFCPQGFKFPEKTFVQSSNEWAFVMFHSLIDAKRAIEAAPWLRCGTLVDWMKVAQQEDPPVTATATEPVEAASCDACKDIYLKTEMVASLCGEELYCKICFDERKSWTSEMKEHAVCCVVTILEMMADNDDIYIVENILRKQLALRWRIECNSPAHAALWIGEAIEAGAVLQFKRPGNKNKLVCLPVNYHLAVAPFPPTDLDTSLEEAYVIELLWENNGWKLRTELIDSLKEKFETMETPIIRNKMFLNAANNGKFFIAKGPHNQVVGLTKEDAWAALELISRGSEPSSESLTSASVETQLVEENVSLPSSLEEEALAISEAVGDDDSETVDPNNHPSERDNRHQEG